jgi:hypothetical protein
MKSHARTLILAACMGALGGPLFAQSSHRIGGDHDNDSKDRREGTWNSDRRDDAWDDRRESYWDNRGDDHDTPHWSRGSQRYEVPRYDEMRSIRNHAQSMNQRMDDLIREFERDHRASSSPSYRGIITIAAMRRAAREFLALIDSNMTHPERTVSGFQKLKESHERFESAAARRDLDNRTERHVARLKDTMNSLDRLYMRSWRQPSNDWNRLQRQANDVDELANRIYINARRDLYQRSGSRSDWRNRGVLERLLALRDSASHFNEQMRRGQPDSARHLREDFDDLEKARRSAAAQIGVLRDNIRNDFGRLTSMIQQMEKRAFDRRAQAAWSGSR